METQYNIKNNTSLLKIENFFFFYNLLLAARATVFTTNMDPRENFVGFFLLVIPMMYLYNKYHIKINDPHFIYIIIGVTIWIGYHIYTDPNVRYLAYILIYIRLLDMYLLVKLFHFRLIKYTERGVVALSAIALIMWGLMHVIGVDTMSQLGFMEPAAGTSSASFLIFNTPNTGIYTSEKGLWGLMRNCGFCWEPGLFASFIVIGMVFNILIYKNLYNRRFLILTAALFTTFSTTGYVAFIILLGLYYINKLHFNKRKMFINIAFFIPFVIIIFQFPFMREKIVQRMNMDEFVTTKYWGVNYVEREKKLVTVDRFEGIVLDYYNFTRSPLMGYGQRENSYVYNEISPYLITSNGLMSFMAEMGFIIVLFYILILTKSSKYISKEFNYRISYLYLIIFLLISISYSFVHLALFNAIAFLAFIAPKDNIKKEYA